MSRLLVIEDEPIVLKILVLALEAAGHDLITAEDGNLGLEQAREHKPDLIITDMSLPKLTGWQMIAKIREDSDMGEIPIIALTAHATSEDRVAAYEAGVSDYEQKPVDIAKLLSRIDDLLKN